jgi:large subunit ribosomal protein L25
MKFDLAAEIRTDSGKGAARQLRRKGRVPAVLYGQGECVLLTLDPEHLRVILRAYAGSTALITVKIAGVTSTNTRIALLRDYQLDPVSGDILHADLFEVLMNKAIRVKVPVSVTGGQPAGVKEGGILQHNTREILVECLPSALPDSIPVDASPLAIGQGIHVRELQPIAGVRFLDGPDQMVVSVAAPMSEAKLEALLTSAATTGEGKEPEVIAKGKEAAAAAEAAAGAAPAGEAKPGAPGATATAEKGKEGGKEAAAPKTEKKEAKEEKKK